MRLLIALLLWTWPALAEPITGADDPGFQTAWQSLLTTDDPAALHALHDLAAQGNTAALIALPLAQSWLPPQPDRMELRRIGGVWARDLAHDAHKPAALWAEGDISPSMTRQLDRALWLYDLGETRKADALLKSWFNHMPRAAALPEGLTGLDASPMLTALILLDHLTRGDRKALAPLQALLDQDRIEGWMVLAELNDHYPVTAGPPIQANLRLGATMAARLGDGRRTLALLWHERPPPPLPPEVVEVVLRDLLPRPQFGPVRAFCAARCAATAPACAAAFVTLLGDPHPSIDPLTPLDDLLGEARFFASPRGAQVLLSAGVRHSLGLDLVADARVRASSHPALAAARDTDACLADAALLALEPFPTAP